MVALPTETPTFSSSTLKHFQSIFSLNFSTRCKNKLPFAGCWNLGCPATLPALRTFTLIHLISPFSHSLVKLKGRSSLWPSQALVALGESALAPKGSAVSAEPLRSGWAVEPGSSSKPEPCWGGLGAERP